MSKLEKVENGDVLIDTLDSILFNKLSELELIKIDVEGMGMDVLKGAEKIIEKFKPQIYIEAETEIEFKEVSEYLQQYGYRARVKFNATPTYLFEIR